MERKGDIMAILLYFLAAFIALNKFGDFVAFHILGIAFIIAGVYGIVCLHKKHKFVF